MKLYYIDQTTPGGGYDIDTDYCYTLRAILAIMKENGLTEVRAYEAKAEKIENVFYCRAVGTFTDTAYDNPCGKQCEDYSPRNGKSGRCRYHDVYSYDKTDKMIVLNLNLKQLPK